MPEQLGEGGLCRDLFASQIRQLEGSFLRSACSPWPPCQQPSSFSRTALSCNNQAGALLCLCRSVHSFSLVMYLCTNPMRERHTEVRQREGRGRGERDRGVRRDGRGVCYCRHKASGRRPVKVYSKQTGSSSRQTATRDTLACVRQNQQSWHAYVGLIRGCSPSEDQYNFPSDNIYQFWNAACYPTHPLSQSCRIIPCACY
jgi:hypothetical protein